MLLTDTALKYRYYRHSGPSLQYEGNLPAIAAATAVGYFHYAVDARGQVLRVHNASLNPSPYGISHYYQTEEHLVSAGYVLDEELNQGVLNRATY